MRFFGGRCFDTVTAATPGEDVSAYFDVFGRLHTSVDNTLSSAQSGLWNVNQTTTAAGFMKLFDGSGVYNVAQTIVNVGGLGYGLIIQPDLSLNFPAFNADGSYRVTGNVAHDSPDTFGAVKIGGKAASSEPTAVSAGDRVDAYFDTKGYQHTIEHGFIDSGTAISSINVTFNTTGSATSGADITVPTGSRTCDLIFSLSKSGTPTDIQFFLQAKDGSNYFTMKNGFLGKFIFDDTAVATAKDVHVCFPAPKTGTMRVRVVSTGCNSTNTFTVANAKIFFGS